MKLRQGKLRLGNRESSFTQELIRHWIRLLREVVTAPSLKEHLDNTLSQI